MSADASLHDKLLKLAADLTSDNFLTAKDAQKNMKDVLSPECILIMVSSPEKELSDLLEHVTSVGNTDVYEVVNHCLNQLLKEPSHSRKLVEIDRNVIVSTFIIQTFACPNISLAMTARIPFMSLLEAYKYDDEKLISSVLESNFQNDNILRLFDCDRIDSAENEKVFYFLKNRTSMILEIIQRTKNAFDNDILLLANYMMVCGLLCRIDESILDEELQRCILSSLHDWQNDLVWISVAQCCSCALWRCAETTARYGKTWIHVVVPVLAQEQVSDDVAAHGLRVLGSACSTKLGWDLCAATLPLPVLLSYLRSKSITKIISTFNLLGLIFESPHYRAEWDLNEVMLEGWKLRSSVEDTVRLALWSAVEAGSSHGHFPLFSACVSCLSNNPPADISGVRERQLRVADALLQAEILLPVARDGLNRFLHSGIYPPGSSLIGVLPT